MTDQAAPNTPATPPATDAAPASAVQGMTSAQALEAPPNAMVVGREHERSQAAVERLRAKREQRETKENKPKEASADSAQNARADDAPKPKQADKPADKAPEKATSGEDWKPQLDRATKAALEHEKRALAAEQKLAEMVARLEKVEKANPLDLLKERGTSLEQLVRDAATGKIKPTTELDVRFEAQASEVEKLRRELDEIRQARETESKAAQAQRDADAVRKRLEERAEALPLSSSLSWVPERARDHYYALRAEGQDVQFDDVLTAVENAALSDAKSILGSERALKAIFADAELRQKARGVLDSLEPKRQQQRPSPASDRGESGDRNSPSTFSRDDISQPGTRRAQGPMTDSERTAAAIAALRRKRSA